MRDNRAEQLLDAINAQRPAVHCLTNTVVQALTANMLLAVGAVPSMSSYIKEVADFTASAKALIINLGTLDWSRIQAIEAAIATAREKNIPWILDPVLIDRAPQRLAYAKELVNHRPALIRGNQGEIAALSPEAGDLARKAGAVIAVTGVTDLITDGQNEITLSGGHEMMSRVTGVGCAGTALLGAYLAVAPVENRVDAVAAGLSLLKSAGEKAARLSCGPGTFAASLLDEIFQICQSNLQERKEK